MFTAQGKTNRIEVRFPEGSVFDLSHMGGVVFGVHLWYKEFQLFLSREGMDPLQTPSHMGEVKNWPLRRASKSVLLLDFSIFFILQINENQ